MKINNKKLKQYGLLVLLFGIGIFTGIIFSGDDQDAEQHAHQHTGDSLNTDKGGEVTEYTCSMHPGVRQEEPGDCPICGMDLIPAKKAETGDKEVQAFEMTSEAMKLAQIQTSRVSPGLPQRKIRLDGTVVPNEEKVYSQVIHFPGRLEALRVNYKGEKVKSGQKLATVYSPKLVAAQKELLEAAEMNGDENGLFSSAKEKLQRWKLSDEQINEILNSGEVKTTFAIYAETGGVVTDIHARKGDYMKQGDQLFEIADLRSVWISFEAYERDLAWLEEGQNIHFEFRAIPGREFQRSIDFIDPLLNEASRVAHVRVEMENTANRLKPGMFASGTVVSQNSKEGEQLRIPKSAVLWTGERSVIYVKDKSSEKTRFKIREIRTGAESGDYVAVLDGLSEGERVVSHGTFAVDAAAQLAGKASMMNVSQRKGKPDEKHQHAQDLVENPQAKSTEHFSEAFKNQWTSVVEAYLDLKNQLVNDQPAGETSQKMITGLNSMQSISDAPSGWMDKRKKILSRVTRVKQTNSIKAQRKHFIELSNLMIHTARQYGIGKGTLYVQFCPMANDDKGAYWLSEEKQIANPYYGDQMLRCGEVKDEIRE